MARKIGFDRRIELAWMDALTDELRAGRSEGELRDVAVTYEVLRGGRNEVELSIQAIEGDVALTALRTTEMPFELPPLGEKLDEALSLITDAYQTYVRIPKDERPFDGASRLDMLVARWRYLDSQLQRRASLTPDVLMALVNRAQALAEDAALMEKEFGQGGE